MRQSELFTRTRREAPKDEVAKNAQLLIRAGFIYKDSAGVYALLPLGLRVFNKIVGIIREEMNALGGQELVMTALQRRELWEQTGRWSDQAVEIWFKTKLKNDSEIGLAWSHEEPVTEMIRGFIASYRDLPRSVYQFQTKFRNETRAKSGIMRTREFVMKDMYSFARTIDEHEIFYNKVKEAYAKIFSRVGLGERTYLTFASGGAFAQFSHEFQTICEAGEDTIYVSADKKLAVNIEVCNDEVLAQLDLTKEELVPHKAIEVGNIFNLGTQKSEPLGLYFTDEAGQKQPVVMGSYGIGPARVMGAVVEVLADEKGLVWPPTIAPFDLHLIELSSKNPAVKKAAEKLYRQLTARGQEILYDDRAAAAGEKFADSDLIGIPERLVVSEKTLAAGEWERTQRKTDHA